MDTYKNNFASKVISINPSPKIFVHESSIIGSRVVERSGSENCLVNLLIPFGPSKILGAPVCLSERVNEQRDRGFKGVLCMWRPTQHGGLRGRLYMHPILDTRECKLGLLITHCLVRITLAALSTSWSPDEGGGAVSCPIG